MEISESGSEDSESMYDGFQPDNEESADDEDFLFWEIQAPHLQCKITPMF